jgi:8-oxo-dGTP pyrophosphatase MutT (NUDIX family)
MGNNEASAGEVEVGQPAALPRPAASIVLLSEAAQGALQVALVRRSAGAAFMPAVWVFPGGTLEAADGGGEAGRRACALRELAEEAGVELAAGWELVPFAHWITPEALPQRYDAWFYLALAPAAAVLRADGREITAARWFEPRAALGAHAAGQLALAFPTVKQLQSLIPHRTAAEVLEAHRGRAVPAILPKLIGVGDERRVVMPGEADYPA